ncbi:hypothetical protein ACUXNS_000273 [Brevibacterium pityocampae]
MSAAATVPSSAQRARGLFPRTRSRSRHATVRDRASAICVSFHTAPRRFAVCGGTRRSIPSRNSTRLRVITRKYQLRSTAQHPATMICTAATEPTEPVSTRSPRHRTLMTTGCQSLNGTRPYASKSWRVLSFVMPHGATAALSVRHSPQASAVSAASQARWERLSGTASTGRALSHSGARAPWIRARRRSRVSGRAGSAGVLTGSSDHQPGCRSADAASGGSAAAVHRRTMPCARARPPSVR